MHACRAGLFAHGLTCLTGPRGGQTSGGRAARVARGVAHRALGTLEHRRVLVLGCDVDVRSARRLNRLRFVGGEREVAVASFVARRHLGDRRGEEPAHDAEGDPAGGRKAATRGGGAAVDGDGACGRLAAAHLCVREGAHPLEEGGVGDVAIELDRDRGLHEELGHKVGRLRLSRVKGAHDAGRHGLRQLLGAHVVQIRRRH